MLRALTFHINYILVRIKRYFFLIKSILFNYIKNYQLNSLVEFQLMCVLKRDTNGFLYTISPSSTSQDHKKRIISYHTAYF